MQTFLPFPSFTESARVLDRQRLGKQRVEVLQLLRALHGVTKSWANHPAARMWRGYEFALGTYGMWMCEEWMRRGYVDTCYWKIEALRTSTQYPRFETAERPQLGPPPWLGDPAFHASHRSNLLRKDPVHYGQFGWTEPDNLPYVWPAP